LHLDGSVGLLRDSSPRSRFLLLDNQRSPHPSEHFPRALCVSSVIHDAALIPHCLLLSHDPNARFYFPIDQRPLLFPIYLLPTRRILVCCSGAPVRLLFRPNRLQVLRCPPILPSSLSVTGLSFLRITATRFSRRPFSLRLFCYLFLRDSRAGP